MMPMWKTLRRCDCELCFLFQMMNDAEKEDEKKEEAEKTQMLQELHNLDNALGDGDDVSK